MAETINMPKLGFDMAEGTLVRWVKKEGENINKGDVLAEIETDKATVEVESSASGVLRKLLVDEGAVVPVSTPIAVVGSADEKIEVPQTAPAETKAEPAPAPTQTKDEAAAAPSEAKPAPGPVQEAAQPQPAVPRSQPTGSFAETSDSAAQAGGMFRASPLAKRLASERNIDISRLQGSGPGGRIVRKDIEQAATAPQPAPAVAKAAQPAAAPQAAPPPIVPLSDQTVPMSKLRSIIARRMTESKTTIPHFYVTHEYNAGPLLDLRKQINAVLGESEKVSVNDLILKAVALTLHQFPNLNASLNAANVLRHGSVNIGVAVSLEGGLMTVVCRDADLKSIRQISTEVKSMAAHAREGKVRQEEIEGSTFSISNMGMYDVENFSAIINPPEAAILAVGTAREVPVVENAEVKPGWRMKATIAVDHRVSDGVEGAKFMQALAAYIETPVRMLI
jgi:pyruvate dehydrogenase E2 component (dihydrolipoamide acetyltransferase)